MSVTGAEALVRWAPSGWIVADLAEGVWTSGFLRPSPVAASDVAALHRDGVLEVVDVRADGRLALRIDPEAAQRAVRRFERPPKSHQFDWHLELGATPVGETQGWGMGVQQPFRMLIGFKRSTFVTFLDHLVAIKEAVAASEGALVGGTFVSKANLVATHALPNARLGILPLHRFEEDDARFRYLPQSGLLHVRLGRLPGACVQGEPLSLEGLQSRIPLGDRQSIGVRDLRRIGKTFQELREAIVPSPSGEGDEGAGIPSA